MKKSLLSLFAVLLSATMSVSAQVNIADESVKAELLKAPTAVLNAPNRSASVQPKRVTLADGERILGYYTGDDYNLNDSIGLKAAGTYRAGVIYSAEMARKYVDGQITKVRFALKRSIGASKVRIPQFRNL